MKIGITGHTSGIGKAISDKLLDLGHEVRGFSRSNGFDISDPMPIVEASGDCDVFINNAHSGYHQTTLLYRLYERWKRREGLILSVGSYGAENLSEAYEYGTFKAALEHASKQLDFPGAKCRVGLVRLGYVDTPAVKNRMLRKIPCGWVADAVVWMIDQPASVFVRDITALPR